MSDSLYQKYQSRRNSLISQFRASESKVVKEELALALVLTDATIITVQDIAETSKKVSEHTIATINAYQAEHSNITSNLELALKSSDDTIKNIALDTAMATQRSTTVGIELANQQAEYIELSCKLLLENLENLYSTSNRDIYFAGIETVVGLLISQVPIVGVIFDALKGSWELIKMQEKKHKNADDYFRSLECYHDAARLQLYIILTLCGQVENIINKKQPLTSEDINERVENHINKVIPSDESSLA